MNNCLRDYQRFIRLNENDKKTIAELKAEISKLCKKTLCKRTLCKRTSPDGDIEMPTPAKKPRTGE